ncbi:CotH kinase family protein, partial [bacterium]|nr:CotH kinase family protein [bacterium]
PENPRPGQSIRIEATINDDHGVETATVAFRTLTEEGLSSEKYVPMTLVSGNEISGRFQATLGGFSDNTLVRFQIRIQNSEQGNISWPHPQSLRPALSFFVTEYQAKGLVPHVLVINPSGTERAKRKYDIQASAQTPEPTRGNSVFIFFQTGSNIPQVRDFVRVGRRTGGYKIRFRSRELFQRMSTLNLLDEGKPRFALSEFLSYELFRMAGVPTPYADHYRLRMDQEWKGYQLVVEQPNKAFLRRNGRSTKGNLYKLLWYGRNFIQQHEKKTNLDTGHDDIIQTVQALGRLSGEKEWRYIRQHFNVDEFATLYAVNQCISNWDGYFNNYFIYHDTGNTGKWEIYPWDTDKTWGDFDGVSEKYDWYSMPLTFGAEGDQPGGGFFRFRRGPFGGQSWWRPPGHMSGPLLANTGFRQVFLQKLSELLNTTFTEENLIPIINSLEDRLGPEVLFKHGTKSSWAADAFRNDIESLRNQVKNRRNFLLKNL